jgi:hypothetical protein
LHGLLGIIQQSFQFEMDIQFSLHGSPLMMEEAEALVKACPSIHKPVNIELANFVDTNLLASQELFDLAVKTKNEGLASLAFKISVVKENKINETKVKSKSKIELYKYEKKEVKVKSVESIIEEINNSNTYTHIGAAMILNMTSVKDYATLRETAIHYSNLMWKNPAVPRHCKFFKGFYYSGSTGMEPIHMAEGIERKHTFHVSPIYIALREGLGYCLKEDLISSKKFLSTGSLYKEKTAQSESMRRTYYKFKATEKGKQVQQLWADLESYIINSFITQASA